MKRNYTEQNCYDKIEKERGKAEYILQDKYKIDKFLKALEIKLYKFPHRGNQLAALPVMISLVKILPQVIGDILQLCPWRRGNIMWLRLIMVLRK